MSAVTRVARSRPLHLYGSKSFIFVLDAVLRSLYSLMCIRGNHDLSNVARDELRLRTDELLTIPDNQSFCERTSVRVRAEEEEDGLVVMVSTALVSLLYTSHCTHLICGS